MIDGVVVAQHTVVVALVIAADGKKHTLGLWEGATTMPGERKKAVRTGGPLLSSKLLLTLTTNQGILTLVATRYP